jgi:glycolate oxidase FAD binding subunit
VTTSAAETVLAQVLPAGRLGSATDRARFAVDGHCPGAVAFPESIAELRDAVGAATAADLAVLPAGHGRHLDTGMPPAALDCAISTARLARIIEHAATDMTITVEAGARVVDVQNTLLAARQWLPLDPPVPSSTTIGGLIAANLSGPLRYSQGGVRDLVLGLRAVRADGRLISSGGRVVKNVAGYDLHKAFAGSHGTLGVIAEATFKVRPRPELLRTLALACPSLGAAQPLVDALGSASLGVLWIALASTGAIGGDLPEPPPGGLLVAAGLGGSSATLAARRERIAALADSHAGAGGWRENAAAGPEAAPEPYPALRDFIATAAGDVAVSVALLPSDLAGYIADATTECERLGVGLRFVAEAAVARIHLAVSVGSDALDPAPGTGPDASEGGPLASLILRLRNRAHRRGGHLTIRRAPPSIKRLAGVWDDLGPGAGLMRRLKQTLDPRGSLCRGRFIDP